MIQFGGGGRINHLSMSKNTRKLVVLTNDINFDDIREQSPYSQYIRHLMINGHHHPPLISLPEPQPFYPRCPCCHHLITAEKSCQNCGYKRES